MAKQQNQQVHVISAQYSDGLLVSANAGHSLYASKQSM